MPKQTYSILKSAADDTLGELYIVAEGLPTRAAALIVLSLKDQQSAGVFTIPSLPEYVHIVMPMRM